MKSKDDILLEQAYGSILEEAKKKVNPWAVCTASAGREDKEKYERCVKGVKKKTGYKEDKKDDKKKSEKKDDKKVVKEDMAPVQNASVPAQDNDDDGLTEFNTLIQTIKNPILKQQLEAFGEKYKANIAIGKVTKARDEQPVKPAVPNQVPAQI